MLQLPHDNVLTAQRLRGHTHNTTVVAVCFRCSVRADCQDAAKDVLYWINYTSDRCTTIESVTPHQLQATTARTVSRAAGLSLDFGIHYVFCGGADCSLFSVVCCK